MMLVTEIRKQLSRYLDGKLTIQAFQEWFDAALDGPECDEAGVRLGTMVEWAFNHLEQGLLSEDGLQKRLHSIAESPPTTPVLVEWLNGRTALHSPITGNKELPMAFQQLSSGAAKLAGFSVT